MSSDSWGDSAPGAGGGRGSGPIVCHNCGKPGHKADKCWAPKGGNVPKCHNCHEPGHKKDNCPKLRQGGSAPQQQRQSPKEDDSRFANADLSFLKGMGGNSNNTSSSGTTEAPKQASQSVENKDKTPTSPGGEGSTANAIKEVTQQMAKVDVKDDNKTDDEDDNVRLNLAGGIHPNDSKATVELEMDEKTKQMIGIYKAAASFEDLPLTKELVQGIYDMKFVSPSKIQAQALPIVLAKEHPNLIGQAHHGSGKTAAYALAMLSRVDESKQVPQAICVCPVRELAIQVAEVCNTLGKFTKIKTTVAVPESGRGPVTAQIVIGTPGTLKAKLNGRQPEIDGRHVIIFVADEADQMVDEGGSFLNDTIAIKKLCARNVQVLLFSATFPVQVRTFAERVAERAARITVKTEELSLDGIKQFWMDFASEPDRYIALSMIYGLLNIGQSIIFVQTVATAKDLANRMRKDGHAVSVLYGKGMEPAERDKVMAEFRKGTTNVLITTNVLARGIDVLQVTMVVNYDIPIKKPKGSNKFEADPETYIHRIGRSGRFGRKGVALNFCYDQASRAYLGDIAKKFGKEILQLPTGMDNLPKITEIVNNALKAS